MFLPNCSFRLSMLALVLPVVALNMPSRIAAAQSGDASFEREVVPLLLKSCLGCHNSADKKGGFDLSTSKGAFEAGEDGVRIGPRVYPV